MPYDCFIKEERYESGERKHGNGMEMNRLPNLTDYLQWRFPSMHSRVKCHNKFAGRILHRLAWNFVEGNDNFNFDDARKYIKMKCPHTEEKRITLTASRVALLFHQFKKWASKVNGLEVAASRLSKIGDVYLYVKPDFITPKYIFEVKFFPPSFPIPKRMPKYWEEACIYSIVYFTHEVYLVFITINGYIIKRLQPAIEEIERIKNDIERFYVEWRATTSFYG